VDRRVAGLAAGTLAVVTVCAAAQLDPALGRVADAALIAAGLACAVFVWRTGGRHSRGWRLIALAPVCTASGASVATVMGDADPVRLAVVRLAFLVPAYLLSIAGGLTLLQHGRLHGRLRGRGGRMAVELALFTTACLVAVQFLYAGPDARWADVPAGQALVLAAGAVTTSAYMVAALTVLGGIESRRQRAALLLVTSAIALTIGRGLGTWALLAGAGGIGALGRFFVVTGLAVTAAAALADPGPSPSGCTDARSGRRSELGQVLPHLAMVVAMTAVGVDALLGRPPTVLTVLGALLCVGLAAAHRWLSAREERRTGARLRRSEAYFRSLVSSGGDAVVLLDHELRMTWASAALGRILGAPAAAALVGRTLLKAVHPDDAERIAAALVTAADGAPRPGGTGLVGLRLQHADGGWRRLEAAVSDLRADPAVRSVVLHCRDVTERHDREERLRGVAYTDPRTGMPNRAGLLRVVERVLDEPANRSDDGVALLLFELDGFAEAREHARLETVHAVVAEVGRRLRATVREDDVVARMGWTFGVLARETGTEADQLADRCLAVVEQPIVTPDGVIDLVATVGVAGREPADTVDDLVGRAELALRAARAAGPGTATRYRPALGEADARRERLRTDLQRARARGELALLLQPIVSLEEQRVTGLEARLRWRHPELGDIPEAEFLPIAERAALVADLQRFALEEAMRATAALPSAGEPLRLGVGVPTGWAAGGTLLTDVQAALERTGFGPERLVLELTEETVLSGDERVGLDLTTLRLMGVHIALDDFGAGQASLVSLTRVPIDILKLDRSFIARVDHDPQSRALCESVVGIGRTLGLDVVAEGVETPAQLGAVQAFGAGFAQGFLIARPLPPADLARLLSEHDGQLWPGLVGSR
jgi:PAS domain S-box-containing protein/diguanylate cyclase (GGDEF)-like protein